MKKEENGVILHNKEIKKARNDRQLRIIRLTIEGLINTSTKRDCAKYLKVSENSLYKRLRQYPEIMKGVEHFVEGVKQDARRRIDLRAPDSVERIISYADNANSETVGLQANLELLDRAGITKPNTNNIQVNILNDLKKLKDTYN